MAKFYVSRGGRRIYTSKSDFRRRNDLPYGLWVCGDGRGVRPLWLILGNGFHGKNRAGFTMMR
jgi:hypothetical protein